MSEHYGPFEKYSEVMLGNGGVFGLRAGETLDVQEDGRVVISPAPEPAPEEAPEPELEEDTGEETTAGPTYEDEAPAETPAEASQDESLPDAAAAPDAATAFAEAQQNPDE